MSHLNILSIGKLSGPAFSLIAPGKEESEGGKITGEA
jgi:hypothetical protein